jgi:hypothetical protein
LHLSNLPNVENIEYISILLEEHVEGLEVEGVDHLSNEQLNKKRGIIKNETNQKEDELKID